MSQYTVGFKIDIGRQRSTNEDAGAVFDASGCDVAFVVCDGMGGMAAGEVAAAEAVRVVQETIVARFAESSPEPMIVLREAFVRANDVVNAKNAVERTVRRAAAQENDIESDREDSGEDARALMGTTCVAGVIRAGELFLGHAGDSRAYLWRSGRLMRLTDDHSFVGERVKAGDMTEAEAKKSRFRNIVTRAIGIDEKVEPELRQQPLEPGDLLLVCTDGLTTMADDSEIAGMLYAPSLRNAPPNRIADVLVDAANRRGGNDNISVLTVRVAGDEKEREGVGETGVESGRSIASRRDTNFDKVASVDISKLIPALVGAGAMLALLLLAFALVPSLSAFLPGNSGKSPTLANGSTNSVIDFSHLKYDKPVSFGNVLARGEMLSYVPGIGLYCVGGASGHVSVLDTNGKPQKPVENIGIVERELDEAIPSTRAYMTADMQGNVYLSFPRRKVIVKKSPDGVTLTILDGFDRPEAMAVDEKGNLFVVDLNQIKVCRAITAATTPAATGASSSPSPVASATPASATRETARKPIQGSGQ